MCRALLFTLTIASLSSLQAQLPLEPLARLPASKSSVESLGFLDQNTLLVGTSDGWQLFDPSTRTALLDARAAQSAFAMGGTRDRFVIASTKNVFRLNGKGQVDATWPNTVDRPTSLAVTSRFAYFESSEAKVSRVDLRSGRTVECLSLPTSSTSLTSTAHGRIVAAMTKDGLARAYSIGPDGANESLWGRRVARSPRIPGVFSPDGRLFAVASAGRVAVFDSVAVRPIHSLERLFGEGDVRCLTFSSDSRLLAAGTNGTDGKGVVRIWDCESGKVVASYLAHQGDVNAIAFEPRNKFLASAGQDGQVAFWNIGDVPSPRELPSVASAWEVLDSLEGLIAYRAMGAVVRQPAKLAALLEKSVVDSEAERLKLVRLCAELDHDEYRVREKAHRSLIQAGLRAVPVLTGSDRQKLGPEGEQRIKKILEAFDAQGLHVPENGIYGELLRGLRGVRMLEMAGGVEARRALDVIAKTGGRVGAEAKAAIAMWDR